MKIVVCDHLKIRTSAYFLTLGVITPKAMFTTYLMSFKSLGSNHDFKQPHTNSSGKSGHAHPIPKPSRLLTIFEKM